MVAKKAAAHTVRELLDSVDRGISWKLDHFDVHLPKSEMEAINQTLHRQYSLWSYSWIRPHL